MEWMEVKHAVFIDDKTTFLSLVIEHSSFKGKGTDINFLVVNKSKDL